MGDRAFKASFWLQQMCFSSRSSCCWLEESVRVTTSPPGKQLLHPLFYTTFQPLNLPVQVNYRRKSPPARLRLAGKWGKVPPAALEAPRTGCDKHRLPGLLSLRLSRMFISRSKTRASLFLVWTEPVRADFVLEECKSRPGWEFFLLFIVIQFGFKSHPRHFITKEEKGKLKNDWMSVILSSAHEINCFSLCNWNCKWSQ